MRGDTVMPGYWRNPAATAAGAARRLAATGDVGALDDDGFLTLKDRTKDLIISGGSNIYPREVEEVLLRHPARARGRPWSAGPTPEWGEEVVAFVVVATRRRRDARRALPDAASRASSGPKTYVFVDELPKNNYGKVLKTALREQVAR